MAIIQYMKGDIFNSKAQVIVNTVNCQGIMGKGLALAFKQKYPAMFPVYVHECQTGKLQIGRPTIYQKSTPWILNFPTKNHWRNPSKLEYLEEGLAFLVKHYKKAGITSIAFPKLGAQNGKLSWDEVGPLMARYLSQFDIDVYIYIADEDTEYQFNQAEDIRTNGQTWQEFSDIALSVEWLIIEVGLSQREAKKVTKTRLDLVFQSLADIENIDSIAKISISKIKSFVQEHTMIELSSMPPKNSLDRKKEAKNPQKRVVSRKNTNVSTNIVPGTLFAI